MDIKNSFWFSYLSSLHPNGVECLNADLNSYSHAEKLLGDATLWKESSNVIE